MFHPNVGNHLPSETVSHTRRSGILEHGIAKNLQLAKHSRDSINKQKKKLILLELSK